MSLVPKSFFAIAIQLLLVALALQIAANNVVNQLTGEAETAYTFWSEDSYYHKKIKANPTLHANSDNLIAWLYNEVGGLGSPNYAAWTKPIWEADAETPTYTVYKSDKTTVRFTGVPIPNGAGPAIDADHSFGVIDWPNNYYYDFWNFWLEDGKYWSGAGYKYDLASNGLVPPGQYSVGGSNTPFLALAIRDEDIIAGVIEHPLGCCLHGNKYQTYVYPPASRSDANSEWTDTYAIPMGARIQLDPSLDLDSVKRWNGTSWVYLSATAKIICKAMQDYGIVVKESGGGWHVYAEHEYSVDGGWAALGVNGSIFWPLGGLTQSQFVARWRVIDFVTYPPEDDMSEYYSTPPPRFTNSFEDELASWDGSIETDGGDTVVGNDTSNVHHGSKNMKATINQDSVDDYACVYKDVSGLTEVHIRVMNVKFDAGPPASGDQRWLGIQEGPTSGGLAFAGIINDAGTLKWLLRYQDGEDVFFNAVGSAVSPDTNYAVELGVYVHATVGWAKLWVNDVLECESGNIDSSTNVPVYALAGFVYSDASDSSDSHVYADCLCVAAEYIGLEDPFKLTIGTPENGTTDPVPDEYEYVQPQPVEIDAIANEGYDFVKWVIGESTESTDNPLALTMTHDYEIMAYFKAEPPPPVYMLTVNSFPISEMPTTIGVLSDRSPMSVALEQGSYEIIIATVFGSYYFVGWEDGPTSPTRTVNLTEDTTLTALYQSSYSESFDTSFAYYRRKKKRSDSEDVADNEETAEAWKDKPLVDSPLQIYMQDRKETDEKVNRFLRSSESILKHLDET